MKAIVCLRLTFHDFLVESVYRIVARMEITLKTPFDWTRASHLWCTFSSVLLESLRHLLLFHHRRLDRRLPVLLASFRSLSRHRALWSSSRSVPSVFERKIGFESTTQRFRDSLMRNWQISKWVFSKTQAREEEGT
jgi:hypothetical protein